jgi:putative CocE/NonD family hydrolase
VSSQETAIVSQSRRSALARSGALLASVIFRPIALFGFPRASEGSVERFPRSTNSADPGPFEPGPITSVYVRMPDGVQIAVDIVKPAHLAPEDRLPTVLTMTRYWRARDRDGPNQLETLLVSHGFVVVAGDVRGTGASFGTWTHHRSRAETLDFGYIIDWITQQSWSDGHVIGAGNSYAANTADWMVLGSRKALKVIVPRFPDYDPYGDLYFPGGVPNAFMGRVWGTRVKDLDLNVDDSDPNSKGVRPVDDDLSRTELTQAIQQHRSVPSVWNSLQTIVFRDDRPPQWQGESMRDWGIYSHFAAVEHSGTPIQTWAGWMDAGTANGALNRFIMLSNPQRAFIGAWSHGGYHDASPYKDPGGAPDPTRAEQLAEDVWFIKACLSGDATATKRKLLAYFTMGEENWKITHHWPLPTTQHEVWYFREHGRLGREPPIRPAADTYQVDFTATTGRTNRWATNDNGGAVFYGDRAKADEKVVCYTSAPLPEDVEITGHPAVYLILTSTHADGALFAYLEDMDTRGVVRYVTEGQLRVIHRRLSNPYPYKAIGPYHSFLRADVEPLTPGQPAEIAFSLHPVSVLIRAGHRIRIAVSGADADTFARLPTVGDPILSIHRGPKWCSRLVLPVIARPS